jgi:molybdenum cofactor cytidylyltransferase
MKIHAVIPAAGLSRRMGKPKLTLEFDGQSVISRLLETLDCESISSTTVVCRKGDTELLAELDRVCRELPDVESKRGPSLSRQAVLHIETPANDPPDMRTSVEIALEKIAARYQPTENDAWLLIPADHPILDRATLDEVLAAWRRQSSEVMIPTYAGKGGHPTFFRWGLAAEVSHIPENQGINWLLKNAERVSRIAVQSEGVVCDLDTPEDYAKLLSKISRPQPDEKYDI